MFRKVMLGLLLVGAVASMGCTVTVTESRRPHVVRYKEQGWEKLGERMVNGRGDRDTIAVGRAEGRFRRVMIVVEDSALEMFDMDIEFTDGSHYSPTVRAVFSKNSRSQVIDLPGAERTIRKVTFRYGNLPGGGNASIELWGKH